MKLRMIVCLVLVSSLAFAGGPFDVVTDDGDGTCSLTSKHLSVMDVDALRPSVLAIVRAPIALPACAPIYYAWSGSNIGEAAQEIKDAVDAAIFTDQLTASQAMADAYMLALRQASALTRPTLEQDLHVVSPARGIIYTELDDETGEEILFLETVVDGQTILIRLTHSPEQSHAETIAKLAAIDTKFKAEKIKIKDKDPTDKEKLATLWAERQIRIEAAQ